MSTPSAVTPGRLLLVLYLGVLMAALDIAMLGPVLPALREHFQVDERTVAWALSLFVLFNLVGVPLMARLSDVYGRRLVLLLDVSLFAVGAVVAALAPSFSVLLVGRSLQGLGAAGIFPVANALIGEQVPPEKRGRALGVLGSVFGFAFILGPILAGVMLRYASWSYLFLLNVPLAVLIGGLAFWLIPPSPAPKARPLDGKGLLVFGLLLGALAYGINRLDRADWFGSLVSSAVLPWLLLSLALVPVLLRLQKRAADPLLRLGLLRSRQVRLAAFLAMGAGLSEAVFSFFPLFAVLVFDVPKSTASFMLLPLMVAIAIGSPLAGRWVDRAGSKVIVLFSTLLLTTGLFLLGSLPITETVFYSASVLIGVGLAGLLGPSLNYILLNEARSTERTVAQGVISLSLNIGILLGSSLIGAITVSQAGQIGGYQQAFVLVGVVGVVLIVFALRLKGRREEQAVRPA